MVIFTVACLLGCGRVNGRRTGVSPVTQHDPAYFAVMERGHDLERRKNYAAAITTFREALSLCDGLDHDIRRKAKIAVHNRLGACYRSEGNLHAALHEFSTSVDLGDAKFAPIAMEKLRRSGLVPGKPRLKIK